MKATHSAVHHDGKTYRFNLEYQVEKHLRMHLLQWPNTDPEKERREIRSYLLRGQCWYWPEPKQLDLFGGGCVMDRAEYLIRRREFQPRGMQLPQSKLTPLEVASIRSAARQRESLRHHIRANLSNAALAEQFGVHVRTIEKVLCGETWGHV